MFKVNNKDTRMTPLAIGNFEYVIAGWNILKKLLERKPLQ